MNRRRFIKMVVWVPAILLSLSIAAAFLAQTRSFKDWLRDRLTHEINDSISATLQIGSIDGNLFRNVKFRDVRLTEKTDTILTISRIDFDYSLFRLLGGSMIITKLEIDSPTVFVGYTDDSTWNVSQLIQDTAFLQIDGNIVSRLAKKNLEIHEMQVRGGAVHIKSPFPYLPHEIADIDVSMGAEYDSGPVFIQLREVGLSSYHKQLPRMDISFQAEIDSQMISLRNLAIQTPRNHLTAELRFKYRGVPEGSLHIQGSKLALEEFNALLPMQLQTSLRPSVSIAAQLHRDSLSAHVMIVDSTQEAVIDAYVASIGGFISDSFPVPRFTVESEFHDVEPALWTGAPGLDLLRLGGNIGISGSGRSVANADASWTANLYDCTIFGETVTTAGVSGTLTGDQLAFDVSAEAAFGRANLGGRLSLSVPEYHFSGDISNFDIMALLTDSLLSPDSGVNLHVRLDGGGTRRENIQGRMTIGVTSSSLSGVAIDSSYAVITAHNGDLSLDSLMLVGSGIHMTGSGRVTRDDSIEVHVNGHYRETGYLRELIGRPDIGGAGQFSSDILGTVESLNVTVRADFESLEYGAFHAQSVRAGLDATTTELILSSAVVALSMTDADFEGTAAESITVSVDVETAANEERDDLTLLPDTVGARFKYDIANLRYGDRQFGNLRGNGETVINQQTIESGRASFTLVADNGEELPIDTVALDIDYSSRQLNLTMQAAAENGLSGTVQTRVQRDSIIVVVIPLVDISLYDNHLTGGSDSCTIEIDRDRFRFANFTFTGSSNARDSIFRVNISGALGTDLDEALSVDIDGFRLDSILVPAGFPLPLGGTLSMNLLVRAVAGWPQLTGRFAVTDGFIGNANFDEFAGNLGYASDSLEFQVAMISDRQPLVAVSGYVPVKLALTDSIQVIADRPLFLALKVDSVPLGTATAFAHKMGEADGLLSCDLQVKNTAKEPLVSGALSIVRGRVMIPSLATEFDSLRATLDVDSNRIRVRECYARCGAGYIDLTGQIAFVDILTPALAPGTAASIRASNCTAVNRPDLRVLLDADMNLESISETPQIEGTVEIVEANLSLPSITSIADMGSTRDEESIPLLVQASRLSNQPAGDSASTSVGRTASRATLSELTEKLRGRIKLKMHNNIWIKGKGLRMELAGNLEVVKDSSDLRLFGSIQTLRGQMTLLGRRFDITKGNLTFNGNPKPNPDLSITAENEFLGPNRQKQTLKLELSGNLEQPAFAFLLDNRSITESEAVSYMIFGAAPGDMTSSRQSGVDDVIAMDLASSIASQQLSKTVGEQFDLDYIEVYAADSWQKTSFVAGKYLTDRWFLSYKREFSKEQKQETTPVKLTAEYELSRKVSFRFISGNCKERGVDLLIRFERD